MDTLTQLDLSRFTGSENWYRHWANRAVTYTDGVAYFADNAGNGAHWFLDIVVTELTKLQREHGFLSIHLVAANNKAVLTADDGNDNVVWTRHIDFTDCPDGDWQFFFTNDVILLPSEY